MVGIPGILSSRVVGIPGIVLSWSEWLVSLGQCCSCSFYLWPSVVDVVRGWHLKLKSKSHTSIFALSRSTFKFLKVVGEGEIILENGPRGDRSISNLKSEPF